MAPSKIEWCDRTINPVVGCSHGCSYCYAEKINKRFKFVKDFKQPEFFPDRLREPYGVVKPQTFFVGSMSDPAFWEDHWWGSIFKMCEDNKRHLFMFLTKAPERAYSKWFRNYGVVPANIMFGATVTFENPIKDADSISFLADGSRNTDIPVFLSVEPLLRVIPAMDRVWNQFEPIIVGAMTGTGAIKPTQEMIDSIKNIPSDKLFLKDSIKKMTGSKI